MWIEFEIVLYIFILIVLTLVPMGRHWSMCKSAGCARRHGHSGDHSSHNVSSKDLDFQPPTHLHGEIGALRARQRQDPELGGLLIEQYLRNHPAHDGAADRIKHLQLRRAAESAGIGI